MHFICRVSSKHSEFNSTVIIKEQEEVMLHIEHNVDNAALNIEGGHSEILKYFQKVSENRWLMVKVFGVLIFFFIFFVIFMA